MRDALPPGYEKIANEQLLGAADLGLRLSQSGAHDQFRELHTCRDWIDGLSLATKVRLLSE